MAATLVALGLAWWGLDLLAAYVSWPILLDATVVAGALGTAFLTALAFGLAPAFQATRQDPSRALGTSPAGSGGTRSQSRVRRALVAGQVALSLGLLAVAFQLTSAVPFATLAGSAALLAAAMLLASILPARRAARLNPYAVLREE